jgi:hypothetical protein
LFNHIEFANQVLNQVVYLLILVLESSQSFFFSVVEVSAEVSLLGVETIIYPQKLEFRASFWVQNRKIWGKAKILKCLILEK